MPVAAFFCLTLPLLEALCLAGMGSLRPLYSIGEFSKVTGMTVKALRFYHVQGLLKPSFVDEQTGYRYYGPGKIEVARVISHLRQLEFPLNDIGEIIGHVTDAAEILDVMERQKATLEERMRRYRKAIGSIQQFISTERQAQVTMTQSTFNVEEKVLEPMLIGGIRMKGQYSDCAQGFAMIGRKLGRHVCGKAFLLHYDREYKEDDADFEACMPLRQRREAEGVSIRELPGGRCVSLIHPGPYEQLGRSYARILDHIKRKGYTIVMPTREVYVKGPGMIFRGNPMKYLTEIQMLIEEK